MPILELLTVISCILVNLYPATHQPAEEPVRTGIVHTGATVRFAAELAHAKADLMFERMYGDAWAYAARLSAIEDDVSTRMDEVVNQVLDQLGIDPRDRLALLGT